MFSIISVLSVLRKNIALNSKAKSGGSKSYHVPVEEVNCEDGFSVKAVDSLVQRNNVYVL
jgi:hypothetical protein